MSTVTTAHYSTYADFNKNLRTLEGRPFQLYQRLQNTAVHFDSFSLHFLHIQRSPGATPASVARLTVSSEYFPLPEWAVSSPARRTATEDFILRAFNEAGSCHARQNRGVDGSGSFQLFAMPQQVLSRNRVLLSAEAVSLSFLLSLPAGRKNLILAHEAEIMFNEELPAMVAACKKKLLDHPKLKHFLETIEDMLFLQEKLDARKLVAFIGDGSLLPRESGVSDSPAKTNVIPFVAPEELAVSLDLPNSGKVRGLGIRAGVTVLIGGGFHGKSTLLNALARAVYPHIPGDGRERVVSSKKSVVVSSEEGRSVKAVDISAFLSSLPDGYDVRNFSTENASGSTSQAASIIEAVCAGARLLLIDEDSSAVNFLIRDASMRRLIPDDPIIPLLDRVRGLYEQYGISTLLVAGGSSEYLGVADQVFAMRSYRPVSMDRESQALNIPRHNYTHDSLAVKDRRRILPDNFDPSFTNKRLLKTVPVRIKPLRTQEQNILEYGQDLLDLSRLPALIDADQLATIGYALLYGKNRLIGSGSFSPSRLAAVIVEMIENDGFAFLQPEELPPLFFSQIRTLELAGAMNRLRSLSLYRDTE